MEKVAAAVAEATAPCRVDLVAGIAVAVDRRASARVERTAEAVALESKDTLERWSVPRAGDLPREGVAGLVRRVLEDLGVASGVKVVAQARVPFEIGLGSAGALAVAVGAALARTMGMALDPGRLAALGRHGAAIASADPVDATGRWAALRGGVVAAAAGTEGAARLPVDPARVEECLLLVDPASGSSPGPEPKPSSAAATRSESDSTVREKVADALLGGRWDEVGGWLPHPPAAPEGLGRLLSLVREQGGAGRGLWPGPRSLVLVWAPPGARGKGPRERIQEALVRLGHRTFPCRVDLRGLEVEDVLLLPRAPG
jgi:hypothetical protein